MIWCWLWWIYYVETPCLQGRPGISYHFLPLTHEGKNDGGSNVIPVSTTTTRRNSHNNTHAATNCLYFTACMNCNRTVFNCMVLNPGRNGGLLAFTHEAERVIDWEAVSNKTPYVCFGACNSSQQAPRGGGGGEWVTFCHRFCWSYSNFLVSVVFYLLSPLLIFQ